MNRELIEAAVIRGGNLLDVFEPGWENHIDERRLNMTLGDDCTLGQLHGSYAEGAAKLGIKDGREYGFILARDPRFEKTDLTWDDLRDLWIEARDCRLLANAEKVIRLLDKWAADESGYDEETWPELKAALERKGTRTEEMAAV